MINEINKCIKALIYFVIILLVSWAVTSPARSEGNNDNKSHLIGQTIYRQGILPSGKPAEAFVMKDIPVSGSMFSCESCHRKSGLGSIEANVIVPPVNGRMLYKSQESWDSWTRHSNTNDLSSKPRKVPPFFRDQDYRPAYTDETLAHIIKKGISPAGKQINPIMPTYNIGDYDMQQLIRYLKHISSVYSPGVTDNTIRFATVITDDVTPLNRDAMLTILKTGH